MEGSTLTQRRAECQLKERVIQTDYMMELGVRLALVWQIQKEQEKEMKRIWFETRKMPSLIEENVRDVTNRPLTEFMSPCIDSLPPLAFTNRSPIPTMLHPPSPLAIRAQDAQRFIVFSYFVPAECPVATEATADLCTDKREDLSTDAHLSSMLHRYLPHFINDDSMPPQQTVEGTTEVSVAPVAISNIEKEDRFYPFSLPPLARRFIGNSFNVQETSQPAVSATECRVAKEATAATVKRENRWAARILPSVLPPCLPPDFADDFMPPEHTLEDAYDVSGATEATSGTATVDGVDRSAAKCPVPMLPPSLPPVFDIDYKLPGAAVEGTNKCPVASETTNDMSTHLKEDMAADQSPPDPAALPPSSPCIRDSDHKLTKEKKEDATESSLATEITVGTSIVQGGDLLGDKSPAPRLPPSLSHSLDNDHGQPEETLEGATECSVATKASVANREDPSVATRLPSVLPSSLPLVFDNDYKLPGEVVEGTSKCPVASEAAASVSTVLQEGFLADKSPPAPAALPLRLPCTSSIDHKQPEETVENTTECLVDTEASAVASTVKREEQTGDTNPVLALPPSLACIHDKDHNETDQKGRGTTKEVYFCPHQLDPDANLTLATRNDEPPTPLICMATMAPVRVRASICRSEDEKPRTWTLEEAKDHWKGIETESEESSVKDEARPREGLKSEADCAHSKSSNGMVSSERAETIMGRVGFLVMNYMQKIPFLKMEEKEKNKKLNKKLKDDEKERKKMKNKEDEQRKREKKEMNEREKEQKKVMKAEKKKEMLEQENRDKERKEEEKAEQKRLEGLMKIHNAMMKDRMKKEKKCSEELKKREKAQAEFLEMEKMIQEKEEKKREKMRKEERKRLEKKKKKEPAGGRTERVSEEQGRDESLKMDE